MLTLGDGIAAAENGTLSILLTARYEKRQNKDRISNGAVSLESLRIIFRPQKIERTDTKEMNSYDPLVGNRKVVIRCRNGQDRLFHSQHRRVVSKGGLATLSYVRSCLNTQT